MSTKKLSVVQTASGIGVLGWLGIAFVVLRLVGVIDWSWWLVLLPLYGPLVLLLAITLAAIAVAALLNKCDHKRKAVLRFSGSKAAVTIRRSR